jgi:hypothetical protein
MEKELLVLGAGPAGLAVAKALGERGIPYTQVEAHHCVGGNWAHGVYKTVHIVSSRRTTEFPDHPMPADWPDFPSAVQMSDYMQDYAESHGLLDKIRFNTRVIAIRPRGLEWEVELTRDGQARREIFKGVAVCNGHHWARSFPDWVDDYTGKVLHTKDYKQPEELSGRVLVLGGGNSGCDLICESARMAEAHWSLRRGYHFLPKTFLGRPMVEFIRPWIPLVLQRPMVQAIVRMTLGKYADYGLPEPDHRVFEAHPTISDEVFHYLRHGRIRVRPDVRRAEGDVVVFSDGSRERFDLVVCATGYKVSFPFLEAGTVPVEGKTPQLWAGLLRPEHRHLYIVGAYQVRYGIGPLLRPVATMLARWVEVQDKIDMPLGELLQRLRLPPEPSHLVDPHKARRMLWFGRMAAPLLGWLGRRRPEPRSVMAGPAGNEGLFSGHIAAGMSRRTQATEQLGHNLHCPACEQAHHPRCAGQVPDR